MRLNFAEASNRANAGALRRSSFALCDEFELDGKIGKEGLSVSIEVVWLMTVLAMARVVLLWLRQEEWFRKNGPSPRM